MAEGIYYYDETAPLTRSHNDVLRYQRSDLTPATYLVELPGTLPQPPLENEAHQSSRRGTSIVKMDRPTSEEEFEDLDPLEAYERYNLASFRKSLGPEDLKDARRGRGRFVNSKTAESGCSPAVVETAGRPTSRRPTQNEKQTVGQVRRQTPPNAWPEEAEVMRRGQDEKPAEIETSSTRELVCSTDREGCEISEDERLPKTHTTETPTQREMRNSHLDKSQENQLTRNTHLNETPTGSNKRKVLNENPVIVKMRKTPSNETLAVNEIRSGPPNEFSKNKEARNSTVSESLAADNIRKAYLNENPEDDGKIYYTHFNAIPTDNRARKEQKTTSLDLPPRNFNRRRNIKQGVNEKEWIRADPTAMPMLTDPGGPENGWAPKLEAYVCPNKRRGADQKHSGARSRTRKSHHQNSSSPLNGSDLNSKSKASVKRGINFEESRLEVDLTVELLNDISLVKSSHIIHNDYDHTSPCSSDSEKEHSSNTAERVRHRPNCRSWSANSRRQSTDRSCGKMGNGRLRGGANSHRRSRSASIMSTSKTFEKTENMHLSDDLELVINKNPNERKSNTLDKNNLNHLSRKNSLGDSLKLDDVDIYSDGRVHGGYDGKRKDQPSTNSKTGKPFSYDGMINCDIEDCPCRCHPDYDHSSASRPVIARDRDYKDGTRGKGYDGDPDGRGRPGHGRGKDYPGKGYDPYLDGDQGGKGIPRDGRDRDFTRKGYNPDGRPRDGRGRDYPGNGYDPNNGEMDGKGRPKEGRGRDYPGKGYDSYDGDPDGKGRPKEGRDRNYPGKGYDPYDGDPDGKGRSKDGRGRDYPEKAYDPLYVGETDRKGSPRDERGRGYPGSPARKGPMYDDDAGGKARPRDQRGYPGKGYDPLFDENEDGRARPRGDRDGSLPGKTVGFRPGDRSPYRGDPTQVDDRGARGDKDAGGKGVLKQRVPKTATSLFTYKRYHIKIPDHNLKEPWFNARFAINEDKNVDLKYQGPVKINSYYTSNRYE